MAKALPPDKDEELETVTSADGTEIAFERTGSGPSLVLIHGATLDHRVWELSDVRPSLAEDATVYAIDRRRRGGSGDAEEYEPERGFEDVAAVVESIDEPVIPLGHSAGVTSLDRHLVRRPDGKEGFRGSDVWGRRVRSRRDEEWQLDKTW